MFRQHLKKIINVKEQLQSQIIIKHYKVLKLITIEFKAILRKPIPTSTLNICVSIQVYCGEHF